MQNDLYLKAIQNYGRLPINIEAFPAYASRDDCFAVTKHGFPIDPKITETPKGGLPCVGHPRRCQGVYKTKPLIQCIYWAEQGRIFCHKNHRHVTNYGNWVGPRLQQVLTEAAKKEPHLQMSLVEDLAIARASLSPILEAYEKKVLDPESKASNIEKQSLGILLRDALKSIREMSVAASKVSFLSERTFDADQLQYIFNRMREILERHIPPEAFDAALVELQTIVVPQKTEGKTSQATATATEIRQALLEMDATTGTKASPF